jgi:hypothetical protein
MNTDVEEMLNVATKARELGIAPCMLVRHLVRDGIDVVPISDRIHRVSVAEWERWRALRKARLAEHYSQAEKRAAHVQGKDAPKRPPRFTR